VPHKQFTFAKLWLMYARFEVRRLDLPAARKVLGTAIGMCPKEALFKGYIQLEFDLREFDRVRTLYEKYIEFDPTNSAAWIKYAELETQLADYNRARGIFELGASQTPLSMPELLWKAYIDFEVEEGERARTRALYERLAAASGHWKVWVAYAMFEAQPIQLPRDEREDEDEDGDEGDEEKEQKMVEGDLELARQVFQKGYKDLKDKGLKNERVALLQVWKSFEEQRGTADDIAKVEGMMPVQGKRRYVDEETGQLVEDYDYIFADDEREANPTSFKFLQMAHAWAASRKAGEAGAGAGSGGGDGGALSRFTVARVQHTDKDSRPASDSGNESMDEDVASVASSQGNS